MTYTAHRSSIISKSKAGLMAIFNPMERPWIKPEGTDTQLIIEQIEKCPAMRRRTTSITNDAQKSEYC